MVVVEATSALEPALTHWLVVVLASLASVLMLAAVLVSRRASAGQPALQPLRSGGVTPVPLARRAEDGPDEPSEPEPRPAPRRPEMPADLRWRRTCGWIFPVDGESSGTRRR